MTIARKYSEAEINQIFETAQKLSDDKKYEEAEKAFQIVIQAAPNHPHVLSSYSKLHTYQKNFSKADKFIKSAIKTAPDDIFVLLDLAAYYSEVEDFKGYEQTLQKIISAEPFNLYATINFYGYLFTKCDYDSLKRLYDYIHKTHPRSLNDVILKISCALIANMENNIELCEELLVATEYFASDESQALEKKFPQRRTLRVYQKYTQILLQWRKENSQYYSKPYTETIYIIGDSHSYGNANVTANNYLLRTKLVVNTSAWRLVKSGEKLMAQVLKNHLKSIEKGSKVILSFGEIDCRVNAGIHKHHLKNPEKNLSDSINDLVIAYIETLAKYKKNYGHKISVLNCPAPLESYIRSELSDETEIERYKTIPVIFNQLLAEHAKKHEISIIDIYSATHSENGWSKEGIHLDQVHFKPNVLADLLNN